MTSAVDAGTSGSDMLEKRQPSRALGLAGIGNTGGAGEPRSLASLGMTLWFTPYFSTFTPFQNATYPLICFAAGFGSG